MEMIKTHEELRGIHSNTSSQYKKYKINTKPTPPRKRIAHPFIPRVKKLGLAKILVKEIFEYNFKLVKSDYRKLLMSRPCIYGVFSGKFGGFNPIIEKCTGCMRCVQEFPDVVTVDRNPSFTHFADSYFMPTDPTKVSSSPFATIWYEAETGKIMIRGMGYKGLFAAEGWDTIWTDMSEIVRPTRDGVYGREFISTEVNIGRKQVSLDFSKTITKPLSFDTQIPVIFDYLPSTISSESIQNSLVGAAHKLQTSVIINYETYHSISEEYQQSAIVYLTDNAIERIEEIISTVNTDNLRSITFNGTIKNYQILRQKFSDQVLIAQLKFSDEQIDLGVELAKNGVDALQFNADYHGVGEDNTGFITDLLIKTHDRLVQERLRDQITIIASGGIILAEHIPKAIICGADIIAINTTALVALQVDFHGECKSPSDARISDCTFDIAWGTQRLINLMGSWNNQLIEILSAMGIRDVRRLVGDRGRALFKEELEDEAFYDIRSVD